MKKKIAEIDIIIAEIVSNLVKHAGGGQLLIKLVEENNLQGIEIISIDNGQGMTDVSRMVADGVSTKNTLGHGLGSMKRLSDIFQVYSQKDWGTVILMRVFGSELPRSKKSGMLEIRSIVLPKPGEQACGDGFFYQQSDNSIKVFLGDGLGHGSAAADAVLKAGEVFAKCEEKDPVEIIRAINVGVRKTRGLVGTVAVFDFSENCWLICGVGNIIAKISSSASSKNYNSYNGIIGLNVPNTLNAQRVKYEKGQQLILCSDGVKSRWDSIQYPAIYRYDLSILAATLLKDFARNTDDMSVAACRINL